MNRIAYTDGACNRHYGGWAVVFYDETFSGSYEPATNNLMELYAVQKAVEHSPNKTTLEVYTDSKLVVGWLTKGWECNKEYIRDVRDTIFNLLYAKEIRLIVKKVKGHADNPMNDMADKLAQTQSRNLQYS